MTKYSMQLAVTASPTIYTVVGQAIAFTYTITNTGCKYLKGTLTVANSLAGCSHYSCVEICPGQSKSYTASYTTVANDLFLPQITSVVSASLERKKCKEVCSNTVNVTLTNDTVDVIGSTGPTGATGPAGTLSTLSYAYTLLPLGVYSTGEPFALTATQIGGSAAVTGDYIVVPAGSYEFNFYADAETILRITTSGVTGTTGTFNYSVDLNIPTTIGFSSTEPLTTSLVSAGGTLTGIINFDGNSYGGYLNVKQLPPL